MRVSIRDQSRFNVRAALPRERFGVECRDLLRVGDILIGQARANPRPRIPEFQFAIVEVGAGPSVIAALRSAVDVAGPYPLRPVVRCSAAEQDPATDMPRQITA